MRNLPALSITWCFIIVMISHPVINSLYFISSSLLEIIEMKKNINHWDGVCLFYLKKSIIEDFFLFFDSFRLNLLLFVLFVIASAVYIDPDPRSNSSLEQDAIGLILGALGQISSTSSSKLLKELKCVSYCMHMTLFMIRLANLSIIITRANTSINKHLV